MSTRAFCDACGGPYGGWLLEEYGGHWDTCPNRGQGRPTFSCRVKLIDREGGIIREGWVYDGFTQTTEIQPTHDRLGPFYAPTGYRWRLWFIEDAEPVEVTSETVAEIFVEYSDASAIVSPMTVNLDTVKTAQLYVVRGDVIVSGPYGAAERDRAERGVALANEQLANLGLDQDAQLAEVTQTVSYGKPKALAADEQPSTDDTPTTTPSVDPSGPAVVQTAPGTQAAPGTYTTA